MIFGLSEDQEAFQNAARDFALGEMAPHAAHWDEEEIFPVEALRKAAELGFAGIYVGDDVGGSALGRLDAALIFEELAAACPSTAGLRSSTRSPPSSGSATGAPRSGGLPWACPPRLRHEPRSHTSRSRPWPLQ